MEPKIRMMVANSSGMGKTEKSWSKGTDFQYKMNKF